MKHIENRKPAPYVQQNINLSNTKSDRHGKGISKQAHKTPGEAVDGRPAQGQRGTDNDRT